MTDLAQHAAALRVSPEVPQALIAPDDSHNRALVANVHPPTWVNPAPGTRYNLVVVGAGTAGLVSAVGAAALGGRVALVERHLMGGDCLNFGCVPSKGVLRAARALHAARGAEAFGVRGGGSEAAVADFGAVMQRMRRLRAEVAAHDSARRLTDLGVDVFLGDARFVARDAVEVAGARLTFSRAVIATGARAVGLPVPGLAETGFLTNETVFGLTALPRRLVIIGAGPIGCELGQAFRRLGGDVTIVSVGPRLLPREDADAAGILAAQFDREGIRLVLGARPTSVTRRGREKVVAFESPGGTGEAVGDEILVAAGRAPNVEGLGLDAAGVAYGRAGVSVDDRLRTTNPRIYAAGDICSAYKFTHAADAMARIAIQNALFFGRKKASSLVIPWCTYTEPEIAHVGLYEEEARRRGLRVATFTQPMADVDRAVLDGETEGFARVHVDERSGRVLGATLLANHAGEIIGELVLTITAGLKARSLATTIHPYPTQAVVWRRLGDAINRGRLTPSVQTWLRRLLAWRR